MATVAFLPYLFLIVLIFDILTPAASHAVAAAAERKAPAIYVFGDSTADVGNNNNLSGTTAKANFPHNGIDFPHHRATGRFSNGYNGIDFIASHLGFRRSPPPYLTLGSKAIHHVLRGIEGVSFASGGSGILDSTGNTITMSKQVQYFSTVRSNMTARMGTESTDGVLSKSIFLISSGGNDVFGFFSQNNGTPNATRKEQFINTLIANYEGHIKELYNLGARKIGIVDIPPVGCCPYSRSLNPTGACIDVLNELASGFNAAAKVLMHDLSTKLKGLRYSIGSSYAVVMGIIRDPSAQGFKETETACCGSGRFKAETGCTPNVTYCSDRRRYLFWDMLHPTHSTSKIAGLKIYGGSLHFASPINFKQLLEA